MLAAIRAAASCTESCAKCRSSALRFSVSCWTWVFASERSPSGYIGSLQKVNARIGEECGARFWFDALRTCFLAVAESDLVLPPRAEQASGDPCPALRRIREVDAGWPMEQFRKSARRISRPHRRTFRSLSASVPEATLQSRPEPRPTPSLDADRDCIRAISALFGGSTVRSALEAVERLRGAAEVENVR